MNESLNPSQLRASNAALPPIHSLTGLRFLAALLVMAMHFSEFIPFPVITLPLVRAGGIGVSFFFVLSGFLLYLRYGAVFESGIRRVELKNFYLARFFRIYPAYLTGLLLATLVHFGVNALWGTNPQIAQAHIGGWLVNLLALQTFSSSMVVQQFWNAPAWSVSTEFFFYLSLPAFLFYFTRGLHSRMQLALGIALCVSLWMVLRITVVFGAFAGWFDKLFWVDYVSDRNFFWRFWEFGIGVLMCKLVLKGDFGLRSSVRKRNTVLVLALLCVLVIAYLPWPSTEMSQLFVRVFRLGILNTLPFAVIIVCFWAGRNFLSPTMENRFIVYLGECSYAIYIYHWAFWMIVENMVRLQLPASTVTAAGWLAMLATVLLSMASFSWYESPVRKWATRRFITRR